MKIFNYSIFQIVLTDFDHGLINLHGFKVASELSSKVRCYHANTMPFRREKIVNLKHYTCTMSVEAESLDHVFELTNLWNDESRIARHATFRKIRSGSVGDIIYDHVNNTYHMIASFGFDDVTEQVKYARD